MATQARTVPHAAAAQRPRNRTRVWSFGYSTRPAGLQARTGRTFSSYKGTPPMTIRLWRTRRSICQEPHSHQIDYIKDTRSAGTLQDPACFFVRFDKFGFEHIRVDGARW